MADPLSCDVNSVSPKDSDRRLMIEQTQNEAQQNGFKGGLEKELESKRQAKKAEKETVYLSSPELEVRLQALCRGTRLCERHIKDYAKEVLQALNPPNRLSWRTEESLINFLASRRITTGKALELVRAAIALNRNQDDSKIEAFRRTAQPLLLRAQLIYFKIFPAGSRAICFEGGLQNVEF